MSPLSIISQPTFHACVRCWPRRGETQYSAEPACAGRCVGTARLGIFERLLGIGKKAERDPFEKLYARPSYYLPTIGTEGRAGWTNRSRRISEIWRSPSGNRRRAPTGWQWTSG